MIGRMYSGYIEGDTISAAKTVMEWNAAADNVLLIERVQMGQAGNDSSETTDSVCQRITTAGTTTTSTTAVNPFNPSDTAFSGVFDTDATIEPMYTANTILWIENWNLVSGMKWTGASDDEVVVLQPSAIVGINVNTAITSSTAFNYGATVREIGN